VTTLDNGDFVVTWQSQGQDGSGYGIYQQRFNDNGTKDGGETRVNTITAKDQTQADVTALSTGGYVVTWETIGKANAAGDIHAQVFNASGNKVGKELLVNTHTNSEQLDPSVAALNNGRFVITWQSYDKDGDGGAICQRVFTDKGLKMAEEKLTFDFQPVIEGNGKDNAFVGKDIGEKFYGKGGHDTINAKGGNDLLDGGKGNDLLIGGDGKDVFVFKTGYGNDTIRGFCDGDRIDLSKLGSIADFDDLTENHMSQVGADVLIDGLNGDHIWIRHELGGQLTQEDFIFA
jgi:Ca2+-binding RTX toxin-like protein